jgi:hypothetical protein
MWVGYPFPILALGIFVIADMIVVFRMNGENHPPDDCPLCKSGSTEVKPGSRGLGQGSFEPSRRHRGKPCHLSPSPVINPEKTRPDR